MDRPALRGSRGAVQGPVADEARRAKLGNTRAGDQGAPDADRTLQSPPAFGRTWWASLLQCADDGAHDPPVCRARCRLVGYAPHGYGEAEALRPRLQPHPQGGPHHCRPRRLGESAGHAHRRSHRLP